MGESTRVSMMGSWRIGSSGARSRKIGRSWRTRLWPRRHLAPWARLLSSLEAPSNDPLPMSQEIPRTMDAAMAEAKRLAEKGDSAAQAFVTSGFLDDAGRPPARMLDEPWCNGAVWSMNSMPGIAGEVTDFKLKWNTALRDQLYRSQTTPGL